MKLTPEQKQEIAEQQAQNTRLRGLHHRIGKNSL